MNSVVSPQEALPPDCVGSVVHAFTVLKAFDLHHRRMTLSDVAERTGMTRAGARRYLLTLIHLGYVGQEGRQFFLTPRILDFGFSYLASLDIVEIAQPHLNRLARELEETAAIAVLDGNEIVHLAQSRGPRETAATVTIGRRFNALYNSTGRVLVGYLPEAQKQAFVEQADLSGHTQWSLTDHAAMLKELEDARTRGYAIVDQESEIGLRSIAVPVFNHRMESVAALNLITNVSTLPAADLIEKALPVLKAAARDISSALVAP